MQEKTQTPLKRKSFNNNANTSAKKKNKSFTKSPNKSTEPIRNQTPKQQTKPVPQIQSDQKKKNDKFNKKRKSLPANLANGGNESTPAKIAKLEPFAGTTDLFSQMQTKKLEKSQTKSIVKLNMDKPAGDNKSEESRQLSKRAIRRRQKARELRQRGKEKQQAMIDHAISGDQNAMAALKQRIEKLEAETTLNRSKKRKIKLYKKALSGKLTSISSVQSSANKTAQQKSNKVSVEKSAATALSKSANKAAVQQSNKASLEKTETPALSKSAKRRLRKQQQLEKRQKQNEENVTIKTDTRQANQKKTDGKKINEKVQKKKNKQVKVQVKQDDDDDEEDEESDEDESAEEENSVEAEDENVGEENSEEAEDESDEESANDGSGLLVDKEAVESDDENEGSEEDDDDDENEGSEEDDDDDDEEESDEDDEGTQIQKKKVKGDEKKLDNKGKGPKITSQQDLSKKQPQPKSKKSKTQNDNKTADNSENTVQEMTKGQSRYVVFVGNLPYDVTKEEIKEHFSKFGGVKHIRIPLEKKTNKFRGFAYVELLNSEYYEKALSMHHTFVKGRRINVLYTQGGKKKGEAKKSEIKAKNFKLKAMRQQGKLTGSVKDSQKRSVRRAKQRKESKKVE